MNHESMRLGPLLIDSASGLSYRLRLPEPIKPKQCVLLLHGVGGNETNLFDLAAGVSDDALVILVRGRLPVGANQFAWSPVSFTPSGPRIVLEDAEQSRQALIVLVKRIQEMYGIAPKNTAIGGFSQGGILSASVALTEPECVKGFAILSGRILPELAPRLAAKERLVALEAFIAHGEYDSKLPIDWAERADKLLTELGVQHRLQRYPIDHEITSEVGADFIAWLALLD